MNKQHQYRKPIDERKQIRVSRYGEIARAMNVGLNRNVVLEKRADGIVALVQETVTPTDPGIRVPPQYYDILRANPDGMLALADMLNREDVIATLERMSVEQAEGASHGEQGNG